MTTPFTALDLCSLLDSDTPSTPVDEIANQTTASPHDSNSNILADVWEHAAVIAKNNFQFKSLSNWSLNTAIGCSHGCLFCYVPSTSTNKQSKHLKPLGVNDPDSEWGDYVFVRNWDEKKFLASLRRAENTPIHELKPDGNRAIMLCTTTDAYQVIKHSNPARQRELQQAHEHIVHRSLELIRDHSTLNVRILTRSPLARKDFDLMKSFGGRLLFGMSLPTLNDKLARVYEPNAPSVSQRLKTLQAAKAAGLNVFVAIAPTYPECDEQDIRNTLSAIRELDPVTIFHEPINIRAENVARIESHAEAIGVTLNTSVFKTTESWEDYALGQLHMVETIAEELGLADRLHLWPDKSFNTQRSLKRFKHDPNPMQWLQKYWNRISEWPSVV